MRITVEIVRNRARGLLELLQKRAGPVGMREVFSDFGLHMVQSVRKTILVGGRPNRWPPLKETSVLSWALRRKTWKPSWITGRRPLINTGMLLSSIHDRPSSTGVTIGTNRRGAAIQHFGGPSKTVVIRPVRKKALWWPTLPHPVAKSVLPAGCIPPRPFLVVQDEDWSALTIILTRRLLTWA